MPAITNITGKELIKFIEQQGFILHRQKGNHRVFINENNKIIVIPVYKKKVVKVGLLGGILKDLGISKAEFINSITLIKKGE